MLDPELREYLEQSRRETIAEFARQREWTATEFARLRAEMAEMRTEMRRHFETTIEHIDGKVDLAVEMVMNVDQKLDRESASIRSEMRDGFAETHNLIRFMAQSQ